MIFGTREARFELGSFTSDACTACKKGKEYTFVRIMRFIVVFFINLIPLKTRYEAVCENCGDTVQVDKEAGAGIARSRFSTENNSVTFLTVVKLALLAIVIAAAVLLPILLVSPASPSPDDLKALVSDDGQYGIQNAQGEVFGYVTVEGDKKDVTLYIERTSLIGEPGASGMIMGMNYYEVIAQDGSATMERLLSEVGSLRDRYGTKVRTYHYDIANESLGYTLGVTDLSAIVYSPGKVVYPYTQHNNDGTQVNFLLVMHVSDTQRVAASFEPTSAGSDVLHIDKVLVSDYENGRQTGETLYSISSTSDEIQLLDSVDHDSSAAEILAFIEQTGQQPLYSESYVYYKDTKVLTEITAMITDSQGMIQASTQYIDVWTQGGFYITQESAE